MSPEGAGKCRTAWGRGLNPGGHHRGCFAVDDTEPAKDTEGKTSVKLCQSLQLREYTETLECPDVLMYLFNWLVD